MEQGAAAILMYADTIRSADMRNAIPHAVHDPFLYVEHGDERFTVVRSLEVARMSEVPDMRRCAPEEFGFDELVASGIDAGGGDAGGRAARLRAARRRRAVVPPAFPVQLADRLRAGGVELDVDGALFEARRRAKSAPQLAGIRRAQTAAEAAVAAVAAALHAADVVDGGLSSTASR